MQAVDIMTSNVVTVGLDTSVEEINDAVRAAANGPLKGVLGYTDEKLVSQLREVAMELHPPTMREAEQVLRSRKKKRPPPE